MRRLHRTSLDSRALARFQLPVRNSQEAPLDKTYDLERISNAQRYICIQAHTYRTSGRLGSRMVVAQPDMDFSFDEGRFTLARLSGCRSCHKALW